MSIINGGSLRKRHRNKVIWVRAVESLWQEMLGCPASPVSPDIRPSSVTPPPTTPTLISTPEVALYLKTAKEDIHVSAMSRLLLLKWKVPHATQRKGVRANLKVVQDVQLASKSPRGF